MLGKASSRNLCSSAAHDPSTCTAGSCEQVLASAPVQERGRIPVKPRAPRRTLGEHWHVEWGCREQSKAEGLGRRGQLF